ncbi:MAG: hypothetical protein IPM79_39860 [Polyangiaceae bacterium]|nr:hypothetical protein [Polyangiaceae bacterium]
MADAMRLRASKVRVWVKVSVSRREAAEASMALGVFVAARGVQSVAAVKAWARRLCVSRGLPLKS